MRLIDADNFLERFEKMCETEADNVIAMVLKGALVDEPTAYNVDKVVDQIKTLSPANYVSKDDVLKIVKGDNFSPKSKKNSFFNFDEVVQRECEKARSKAIDDITNEFRLKCLDNMYHSVTLDQIFEIKEQLKGGGVNE